MYCKHCGKQIADDSAFCQYCGGKIDTLVVNPQEEVSVQKESVTENDNAAQQTQEVIIATKDDSALRVEITKKKGANHSPVIANEIVGNLKMIGLAIAMVFIYMIGFMIVHLKDIKYYEYPNISFWGESCYDCFDLNTRLSKGSFNWEEHYYRSLCLDASMFLEQYDEELKYWIDHRYEESISPEQCLERAKVLEKKLKYTEEDIEREKTVAKDSAKEDIENWNFTINHDRKIGFNRDMEENAKYASIISLLLCILGRYFIKLTKWVVKNKTE